MRSVPTWIGKTDDAAIPTRVRLRIYDRCKGRCADCGGKVLPAEYDHIIPLADGGRHSEDNLTIRCRPCHSLKTAGEATERATVRRKKAKHVLPRRSGFRGWRKMNGEVVWNNRR